MKIKELLEFASSGATSSGSIATSIKTSGKAPYSKVIKRMQDDGDYIFGEGKDKNNEKSVPIKTRSKKV